MNKHINLSFMPFALLANSFNAWIRTFVTFCAEAADLFQFNFLFRCIGLTNEICLSEAMELSH